MTNLWKEHMNELYMKMLNPDIDGTDALKLLAQQRGISRAMQALDTLIDLFRDRFETLNLQEEDDGTND